MYYNNTVRDSIDGTETLKMDNLQITILVSGLSVIFIALVILTAAIRSYVRVVNNIIDPTAKAGKKKNGKMGDSAPVIEYGIPGEVVAAISAAVAMMLSGEQVTVRRISRVHEGRSAWSMAGLAENTRPF